MLVRHRGAVYRKRPKATAASVGVAGSVYRIRANKIMNAYVYYDEGHDAYVVVYNSPESGDKQVEALPSSPAGMEVAEVIKQARDVLAVKGLELPDHVTFLEIGNRVVVAGRVYRQVSQFEGTELHVYDFDNTLFKSPDKPSWWPHRHWWTNEDSLLPPCVPEKPGSRWWLSETVQKAKRSIKDGDIYTLMITGRVDDEFADRVTELLLGQDLRFDELRFKQTASEKTDNYKARHIRNIADKFPELTVIHIWDDMKENLDAVKSQLEEVGYKVETHFVKGKSVEVDCGEKEYEKASREED